MNENTLSGRDWIILAVVAAFFAVVIFFAIGDAAEALGGLPCC